MKYVFDILENYVLICAVAGWFSAQFIKCASYFIRNHKLSWSVIMASGGMPSSHSSTVSALVTSTIKLCGLNSVEFALAFVLAFIVMYDAAGVRRAAGEQAKVLNRIATDISDGDGTYLDKDLKELIGHTPFQVAVGAVLGIVVAALIPVF